MRSCCYAASCCTLMIAVLNYYYLVCMYARTCVYVIGPGMVFFSVLCDIIVLSILLFKQGSPLVFFTSFFPPIIHMVLGDHFKLLSPLMAWCIITDGQPSHGYMCTCSFHDNQYGCMPALILASSPVPGRAHSQVLHIEYWEWGLGIGL